MYADSIVSAVPIDVYSYVALTSVHIWSRGPIYGSKSRSRKQGNKETQKCHTRTHCKL